MTKNKSAAIPTKIGSGMQKGIDYAAGAVMKQGEVLCCELAPCSFGLSATSQPYFSLRTNQSPATSQQYFSLRTNQHSHQPPAKRTGCRSTGSWTSIVWSAGHRVLGGYPKNSDDNPNTRESSKHVQVQSKSAKRLWFPLQIAQVPKSVNPFTRALASPLL
jgi:hypothetical protein